MTGAESTSGAGSPPSTTSSPLLVVATFYCTPRGRAAYYEVHLAQRAITAPAGLAVAHSHLCSCLVLGTDNERLYQDALDAEGTPHRVVARWHRDGAFRVLDSLDVQL